MPASDALTGVPGRASVEDQLDSILSHSLFAAAPRMQQFLRFVVESRLNDQCENLKETSVGVAVFGRTPGYDPQIDAIVRVEARRLRSKLSGYYETAGLRDRLLIELPTGSYVPEFTERYFPAEPTAVSTAADVALTGQPGGKMILAAAALGSLVLAVGIGFGWYLAARMVSPAPQSVIRPLTSYPGREFDPQISPDGKQVAFVWDADTQQYNLYTKLLEVGNPVRVTNGPGHDLHPSWSPDGQYLAFLRVSPSEKAVMIVPSLGGPVRKVTDLTPSEVGTWRADATQMYGNPGPTWSPTGDYLVVTDYPDGKSGGALIAVAADGRRLRQFTHPPAGIHDFNPVVSPNGKVLAFVRYTSAYTADLHVMSADGGGLRQLTFDRQDIRGISWLPDSRTILFASNRGNGYSIWSTTTDGAGPAQVALNGYRITDPSISRDGKLLAYTDTTKNSNVWSVPLPHSGVQGTPKVLLASSRQSYCAHYSPDGQRIAFLSDRSGNFEIWVSARDGSEPVQITSFRAPMVGSPRWSPDGRWITFDARRDGHAAVFIVGAAGGAVRQLEQTQFEERMPSWSRDGKWVYFSSNRGGPVQSWKAPATGGAALRIAKRIAFTSSESADGRTVYFTSLGAGIWEAPTEGGVESQVEELGGYHAGLHVAVSRSGIYLVDKETSRNVLFFSFATRRVEKVARIANTMVIDTPSLDISPDEREILYSQLDTSGSDIVLARNWR